MRVCVRGSTIACAHQIAFRYSTSIINSLKFTLLSLLLPLRPITGRHPAVGRKSRPVGSAAVQLPTARRRRRGSQGLGYSPNARAATATTTSTVYFFVDSSSGCQRRERREKRQAQKRQPECQRCCQKRRRRRGSCSAHHHSGASQVGRSSCSYGSFRHAQQQRRQQARGQQPCARPAL